MDRQDRDHLFVNIEIVEIFGGGEKHDGKRGRGTSGKSSIILRVITPHTFHNVVKARKL